MLSEYDSSNTVNSTTDQYQTTVGANDGSSSNGFGGGGMDSVQGLVIAGILALLVSIVVFVFVVKTTHVFKNKFMAFCKEYLNFRTILLESILKFLFLFIAFFITFASFTLLPEENGGILACLALLIGGNFIVRIVFEFLLMGIVKLKNTSDIAKYTEKLCDKFVGSDKDDDEDKKEEPKVEVQPQVQPQQQVETM